MTELAPLAQEKLLLQTNLAHTCELLHDTIKATAGLRHNLFITHPRTGGDKFRYIMKLSTNTRYAVRLLSELGASPVPLSLSTLSRITGMSMRALENVQAVLKQQGVTDGAVGAKGGISLKRSLSEISLGQLIAWFDDGVEFTVCCGEKANECPQQDSCANRAAWRGVSQRVQTTLNDISLDEIFRQQPLFIR